MCVCLVTQLCPTLCDLMDCSPPGFSVYKHLFLTVLKAVESKIKALADSVSAEGLLLSS